jgi:hypothetical protein
LTSNLINHRLCDFRVRGRFNNLSFILVYAHAPLEEKSEYIKDSFYGLETAVTWYPKNNIKILLGDFKAKAGFEDEERSVVRNSGLHAESNNNVLILTGLASALNMAIG